MQTIQQLKLLSSTEDARLRIHHDGPLPFPIKRQELESWIYRSGRMHLAVRTVYEARSQCAYFELDEGAARALYQQLHARFGDGRC